LAVARLLDEAVLYRHVRRRYWPAAATGARWDGR